MRVYVVKDYLISELEREFNVEVFSTYEKAKEYFEILKKKYCKDFNVEEKIKRDLGNTYGNEDCFSYMDDYGTLDITIEIEERGVDTIVSLADNDESSDDEKTIAENAIAFILDNIKELTGKNYDEVEKLTDDMIEEIKNHGVLCDDEVIDGVNQYLGINSTLLKWKNKEISQEEVIRLYGTDKKCPKCGSTLVKSDLAEYQYLCLDCDENFYGFEADDE